MLLKFGVSIEKLECHCRRSLGTVEKVFIKFQLEEPVITSTFEGSHSVISFHYQNKAFDLRRPKVDISILHNLITTLKLELGSDFDIILEGTHIHIEYDPK